VEVLYKEKQTRTGVEIPRNRALVISRAEVAVLGGPLLKSNATAKLLETGE
jgi:hypothetical protein